MEVQGIVPQQPHPFQKTAAPPPNTDAKELAAHVEDLHVVKELKGSVQTHTEIVTPNENISRESAEALIPSTEDIHNMAASVRGARNASDPESLTEAVSQAPSRIAKGEGGASLEATQAQAIVLKTKFDSLDFRHNNLKVAIDNQDKVSQTEIDAFNEEVEIYNKAAQVFQEKFESNFLDNPNAGFYEKEIVHPKDLQQCLLPIDEKSNRYLSYTISDNRKDKKGPVFVFEAGRGCAGTFDGRFLSQAMKEDPCCFVTYDRAGYGHSPARPDTQDDTMLIDQVEQDFDQLLKHLEAQGVINSNTPLILLAHSLGSFFVQKYALEHPEKVSGLVLLDPTPEYEPLPEVSHQSRLKTPKDFLAVDDNLNKYLQPSKTDAPAHIPEALSKEYSWIMAHQHHYLYYCKEGDSVAKSGRTLLEKLDTKEQGAKPYGNTPLLVIERNLGDSQSAWQKNIDQRSYQTEFIVAKTDNHNLQFLACNDVADAIRKRFLS